MCFPRHNYKEKTMLTSDLFVLIFVWIDEQLKEIPCRLRRPGPEPVISDAELLTLLLMQGLAGEISDAAWLRRIRREFGGHFPRLPHPSRYQRRRRILRRVVFHLTDQIQTALGENPRLRIVDSAPIPICRNARVNQCRTFSGEATWGRCPAQNTWFFGFRLHLMVTERGLPYAWDILTAKRHDRKGLDRLLAGQTDLDIFGDAGYNVRPRDRAQFARRGITITASPRKDMKPLPRAQARELNRIRFRIDWTFGLLSRNGHVQRTLARKTETLSDRVAFVLAGFTVGVWVNSQCERSLFHLKELAA
jgi:hypothetical protein